ncbi:amidohydrolase family protein [Enterovibrio norvegicus]|uniref:amidohydrolase family protein n=1 Tax=Enterovibrio norvegicus TaxID=188144 RepID=UPI000C8519B9|nr:amidohydrolase family protein [Enterovibrio norvegicus]PML78935.1 amidohydrolase [Enterovibrio norvegicus]PMN70897.1 amidohydrolase [Enterovibrio norvegicus]
MRIIDAHLHLIDLQRGKYGWLREGNPPNWDDKVTICRDWAETDLVLNNDHKIEGFLHVEAGFDNEEPWREIAWLEDTVRMPFRSIGCVDLTLDSDTFTQHLAKLRRHKSAAGVRHILDEDAAQLLRDPQVISNLRVIADSGLIFEAQFDGADGNAMDAFLSLCNETPKLRTAFNHAGFPPENDHEQWAKNLQSLAIQPNVYIKASGWEMTNRTYGVEAVANRITELMNWFGEDKVMLASNFPLSELRMTYKEVWQEYASLPFTKEVMAKLCFSNAQQFYRF